MQWGWIGAASIALAGCQADVASNTVAPNEATVEDELQNEQDLLEDNIAQAAEADDNETAGNHADRDPAYSDDPDP